MTYGRGIRAGYAEAGFDDIPRLGPRLLGGIRRHGGSVGSVGNVAKDFRISKQAASKLVDTLVIRGYIERGTDRVDRELEEAVGAEAIAQMRKTVGALVALRDR